MSFSTTKPVTIRSTVEIRTDIISAYLSKLDIDHSIYIGELRNVFCIRRLDRAINITVSLDGIKLVARYCTNNSNNGMITCDVVGLQGILSYFRFVK